MFQERFPNSSFKRGNYRLGELNPKFYFSCIVLIDFDEVVPEFRAAHEGNWGCGFWVLFHWNLT